MDNLAQYYILDDNNNDIGMALDPIYLIHNFIKTYGLNDFQIIQQPANTKITANLQVTGDTHNDEINYFQQEVIYLQQIKCDNKTYKLVVYLIQIDNFNESEVD